MGNGLIDLTHQSNAGTHFAKLPRELLDFIMEECGNTMTREEAGAYRKELMGKKSIVAKQTTSSLSEAVSILLALLVENRGSMWCAVRI